MRLYDEREEGKLKKERNVNRYVVLPTAFTRTLL